MFVKAALVVAVGSLVSLPAAAHFVTIYASETKIGEGQTVPVDIIFWHPLFTGQVLNMAPPREFRLTHGFSEVSLIDLLRPIAFRSWANSGNAFRADVPMNDPGDYVLSVVSEPYYEATEDSYIQQFSKTYFNVGYLPTEWYRPIGLQAEIVPLNRPYDVFVGSTFTGQVFSSGVPVAGAEIEVEYLAAEPDMTTHATGQPTVRGTALGSIVTYSDANGYFTFGLAKTGWWGFSALDVGPDYRFQGKLLEQDAVIWVQARAFGQ